MRVLIAGATGVLGRCAIPHLNATGHRVVGLARNEERAQTVRVLGAEVRRGDLFERDAMLRAAEGCDAVLHLATRIPRRVRTTLQHWAENDRVRTEGTRNLIAAAQVVGARYYVQQSITFVYGDHGDAWIDEYTPIPTSQPPILRSAVEMEWIVKDSGLPHAILRGGSFYGSGTGTTETLLEVLRRRALPIVGNGRAFTSLIHVEDMARAVVAAVNSRLEGTFNVVDAEPVRQAEFLIHAARLVGAEPPRRIPVWLARLAGGAGVSAVVRSQRVSSERLCAALRFTFAYPTFREGLAEAVARRSPAKGNEGGDHTWRSSR